MQFSFEILQATMNTLWKQTQSGLMSILSPLLNTFVKEILDSNAESLIERRKFVVYPNLALYMNYFYTLECALVH